MIQVSVKRDGELEGERPASDPAFGRPDSVLKIDVLWVGKTFGPEDTEILKDEVWDHICKVANVKALEKQRTNPGDPYKLLIVASGVPENVREGLRDVILGTAATTARDPFDYNWASVVFADK